MLRRYQKHRDTPRFTAFCCNAEPPRTSTTTNPQQRITTDSSRHRQFGYWTKVKKNVTKAQWKQFYHQNMHYSARNVWYRMIHKQCPSKSALFVRRLRNIEDDKCTLCNDAEDSKHLRGSCPYKNDIWSNIFEQFLGSPKTAIPHQVYQSIVNLNLKQYLIYNLDIKITIFDLFAATIRMIWRFHHLQTFEGVPFDISNVTTNTCAEVMRLSDLKHSYK